MDRYSNNLPFPVDSAFKKCFVIANPPVISQRPKPVGRNIMSNTTPSDVHDMQLHRFIELAYDALDRVQIIQSELDQYYNEFFKVASFIQTSSEEYDEKKVVKQYFENEKIREFRMMLEVLDWTDTFEGAIIGLKNYKTKILTYAGLAEKDYEKFSKEREERKAIVKSN